MSTTVLPASSVAARLSWHRPLLVLGLTMAALVPVAAVGLIVDHRELAGAPVWAKPLKFSLSVLIYSVSLAWLLSQLERHRRAAWWAGTAVAVFLGVEMVIIVGAAAAGVHSHFNVATPLAAALWSTMGASIAGVWVASLLLAVLLFRADLGDRARSLAVRTGLLIALLGMALGFLMTTPTPGQLADLQGVAGAHTVGAADGGPGLALLGWSAVAGDLRVPHFVGMHALQLLPLGALALELGARHFPALRREATRAGLLWVSAGLYLGLLAVLTLQALAGESVVRPSAPTVLATVALTITAAVATSAVLRRPLPRDAACEDSHSGSPLRT